MNTTNTSTTNQNSNSIIPPTQNLNQNSTPNSTTTTTTTTNLPVFNSNSLYVGDLHFQVNENNLYELFQQIGPVLSVRICRDMKSKKSLGYAYVNFQNPDDAKTALDTFNFVALKGQPMRIMRQQRDPSFRKSGIGNIFIKNLDKSIDNKALYETFSKFGEIYSCKVVTKIKEVKDEKGELKKLPVSQGYGFVNYTTQEAADLSIEKVNGMLLNGKKVYVGPFIKSKDRSENKAQYKNTNVYVKNIDLSITDDDFIKAFSKYGKIQHGEVMKLKDNKSKGFGFINFEKWEDAEIAIKEMNDFDLKGKKLVVCSAQKKTARVKELKEKFDIKIDFNNINNNPNNLNNIKSPNVFPTSINVYIKNIDDSAINTDEKLKEAFQNFGEIASVKLMKDKNGISRGFGFVSFLKNESANAAILDMNGKMLGKKPLYVAIAQNKNERKLQLENKFNRGPGPRMVNPMFAKNFPPMFPNANQMFPNVIGGNFQKNFRPRWATNFINPNQNFMNPNFNQNVQIPQQNLNFKYSGNVQNIQNVQNIPQNQPINQDQNQNNVQVNQQVQNQQVQNQQINQNNEISIQQSEINQKKQILGGNIYQVALKEVNGDVTTAGKITGMFLEIEINDLIMIVENEKILKEKIKEAIIVLQKN